MAIQRPWANVALLSLWLLAHSRLVGAAVSPIRIEGSKLYRSDGSQFFAKGVAYGTTDQLYHDPLVDSGQCQIDAGLMKTLGVNTIRVFFADGSRNHDACMQAFASQGIYVWIELPSPNNTINKDAPDWKMDTYTNWTTTVDAFAKYNNTLSFSVGSAVVDDMNSTAAAPYVKAAARDVKAFRDARGYRPIPISYTADDSETYRNLTADYLACEDGSSYTKTTIDMYGLAIYSWCSNSSYQSSGYDKLYGQFEDLNIPVLFSETGCSLGPGHTFDDVDTILGPVFQSVFSGAVVWEWNVNKGHGDGDAGIVQYSNSAATGFPSMLSGYSRLSTVFSTRDPSGTPFKEYTPTNSVPSCPAYNPTTWMAQYTGLPTISGLNISTVTKRGSWASTATATGTGTSTGTATAGASINGDSSVNRRLSSGAIAGIAIGCVLAVSLIAVVIFFCVRRRNVQSPASSDERYGDYGAPGNMEAFVGKAELPASSVGRAFSRKELEAPVLPQEMDAQNTVPNRDKPAARVACRGNTLA